MDLTLQRATRFPILFSLDFQPKNYCEQLKKHYFLVVAIQETGEKGKTIKAISQFARSLLESRHSQ